MMLLGLNRGLSAAWEACRRAAPPNKQESYIAAGDKHARSPCPASGAARKTFERKKMQALLIFIIQRADDSAKPLGTIRGGQHSLAPKTWAVAAARRDKQDSRAAPSSRIARENG